MKKVVKLSIKDLENIVKRTISESELENLDNDMQGDVTPSDEDNVEVDRKIAIGKGEDGKIYVTDIETGEILGTK
jgi:uncharacterized DUF497 family protein